MLNKLDNPVWYSLLESHKELAIPYGNVSFYNPDYCAFGAFENKTGMPDQIDEYLKLTDDFFIVGERPDFSKKLILKNKLVCLQMIAENTIDGSKEESVIKINKDHEEALFKLVNLVQPGFFRSKTVLMGDYYGILSDGELIAVTGERMKMNECTEVSAVVTHPLYTGRGYAKQLVAHTVNKVFSENKTPYLHVNEKNTAAIKLYERSGFKTRRKIIFWNLIKQ